MTPFRISLLVFTLGLSFSAFAAPCDLLAPTTNPSVRKERWPGLIPTLSRTMLGKPVIAVESRALRFPNPVTERPIPEDGPLQFRLEALCGLTNEAQNDTLDHITPRSVGKAWVLAPVRREEVVESLEGLIPEDLMTRTELFRDVLVSLSEEQVRALGAEDGIPTSALSAEGGKALEAALRTPIALEILSARNRGTKEHPHLISYSEQGLITLDRVSWEKVRLRARLLAGELGFKTEQGTGHTLTVNPPPVGKAVLPKSADAGFVERGRPPVPAVVPNTAKLTDLSGQEYHQEYGVIPSNGITTVNQALQQVGKMTGLRLVAGLGSGSLSVFIGSPGVTCGEVLDALPLALAGAWRKVGDAYVLAWDRRGLGRVQQTLYEPLEGLRGAVGQREAQSRGAIAWIYLAENLPFDPAGLVLTTAQRKKLLDFREPTGTTEPFRFSDLTPAQKQQVLSAARRTRIPNPLVTGGSDFRPATEAEVRSGTVHREVIVLLEVFLEGQDWVGADSIRVSQDMLRLARVKVDLRKTQEKQDAREVPVRKLETMASETSLPAPPPAPARIDENNVRIALAVDAPERAVMLPPMPAERLRVVAPLMRKQGLTTLYYPVLFDGYATIGTEAFPPHPGGTASLEDAARIASESGLAVIGYLNTLAWRSAGETPHWLDEHPDWMDMDILGHTRRAWLKDHPGFIPYARAESEVMSDFVSPAVPEVVGRLEKLVSDAAGVPGIEGLAFAGWGAQGGAGSIEGLNRHALTLPGLGYSERERVAEVEQGGDDPIDNSVQPMIFLPRYFMPLTGWREDNGPSARRFAETRRVSLVRSLATRARSARPDLKTTLVTDISGMSLPPDVLNGPDPVVTGWWTRWPDGKSKGVLVPVAPLPYDRRISATRLMSHTNWTLRNYLRQGSTPETVLWDFRSYPEILEEALLWIAPPGTPGADGSFAVW